MQRSSYRASETYIVVMKEVIVKLESVCPFFMVSHLAEERLIYLIPTLYPIRGRRIQIHKLETAADLCCAQMEVFTRGC